MCQPKISVIMPIFNAEKFLDRSLGGVLKQTLADIEVICVNDGSTDNSLQLMQSYALKDKRIVIIDKENAGYGQSMNCGLRKAKGKYISILEPDDFMDKEMLQYLYEVAENNNADVVKSNYYEYKEDDDSNQYLEVLQGLPYNKVTSAKENEWIVYMRPCIWSAIYKKDMLKNNHIVFNETPGASYQDTAFAFKVWVSADKVVFVKKAFLHYCIDNANSSVNSTGKIFAICDEFSAIQSFLNQNISNRNKYSKILQVLKLDSYTWNLNRIAPEFQKSFRDQIALSFIKADFDGFLDRQYFDENRWDLLQNYIEEYKKSSNRYKKIKKILSLLRKNKNQ